MSLIQINNVAMEFAGTYVLKDISCSIERNSRIGLIGANGCGKTTLLNIMLGILSPSEGTVAVAKKCEVAYLPQNMKLDPDLIMLDYIKSSRTDVKSVWEEIDSLSSELHKSHNPSTESRLEKAINRFQDLGGFEFENEVKYILTLLNFPVDTWHKRIKDFSGGEQTRICLASILLRRYDLLILDEPTNHLDIEMIAWLERYLNKLDKPYLIVSHDRAFLDNTVSSILFMEDGSISVTKGNYSSFKEAHEIALMSQQRQYQRQQKWLAETQDFIRRNMAGQKTIQAQSRLKQIQKTEIINKPKAIKKINLSINPNGRSGNDVFVLEEALLGIGNMVLAEDINLMAHYRDRICIIGPNGCGKTTLIKTMLGDYPILDGNLKIGASLDIGYYDQHHVALDESLTVKDTLWQIVPDATNGYILSWLARFGFRGDDVDKTVSILSGGEKSRLYLSVLIHQNPNLLVMDEPTNHLDIEMSDALLSALQDYQGTVLFVSHDRYFVRELATRYWVFRRKLDDRRLFTTIEEIDADLDTAIGISFEVPEPPKAEPVVRDKKKRINPWHLEQVHKQIIDKQELLHNLILDLDLVHQKLSESSTYTDQSTVVMLQTNMADLEAKIATIKSELHSLEDRYLELSYEEA